jgi:hypothetical protein
MSIERSRSSMKGGSGTIIRRTTAMMAAGASRWAGRRLRVGVAVAMMG